MALPSSRIAADRGWKAAPGDTLDELMQIALAFQRSRALLSAVELKVFSAIGTAEMNAGEVAERIGADVRGTERLLNALCSLELLHKTDGKFTSGAVALQHLVDDAPQPLSLLFHAHRWDNWNLLTESVRSGRPTVVKPFNDRPRVWIRALATRVRRIAARVGAIVRRDDVWLRAFVGYLRDHARLLVPKVLPLLDLSRVSRVLDLGGAHAVYAAAFVAAKPDLRVTVFDLPEVVPFARDNAARLGLSDRIDAIGGDFHRDELGSSYDLIFVSETVHANSGPQNELLVQKAYRALNPGGQFVVHDFIFDDDRAGPAFAALFSLDMLMTKEGGDSYTESDVRGWMNEAGFSSVERKDTGAGTTVIVGHKETTV